MYCFQDFDSNSTNTKGKIVGFFFRLASLANKNKLFKILLYPYLIFYKFMFEWVFGFEVPYNTKIGRGLKVYHLQSIVIHKHVVIGENFSIRQNVTIGNSSKGGQCPVLGNNIEIGANACIIGPINIGNNVIIGAGAVVVKNIPENSVVVGNPARILQKKI